MKTVLASGCFDPIHYGHFLHLSEASKMGRLVVALTSDKSVSAEKGEGRPVFREIQRATCLMMVKGVEDVFLCDDVLDALKSIKPDIFVKGKDYRGKIRERDEEFCKANSIEIRFTDTDMYSSTQLLHYYGS